MQRKLVPIDTGEKTVTDEPQRLTAQNMPCDLVLLQISTNPGDGTDNLIPSSGGTYFEVEEEIYWGFNNKPFHQLFPTQIMPFYIPVKDASDIFVRCNKNKSSGERKIVFSTFKYEDIEK